MSNFSSSDLQLVQSFQLCASSLSLSLSFPFSVVSLSYFALSVKSHSRLLQFSSNNSFVCTFHHFLLTLSHFSAWLESHTTCTIPACKQKKPHSQQLIVICCALLLLTTLTNRNTFFLFSTLNKATFAVIFICLCFKMVSTSSDHLPISFSNLSLSGEKQKVKNFSATPSNSAKNKFNDHENVSLIKIFKLKVSKKAWFKYFFLWNLLKLTVVSYFW